MNFVAKRTSIKLLFAAGALSLLFAVSSGPSAYAGLQPEDCIGTCAGPEGPDISNPEPEISEPDYGSEGGPQSEPEGDSEPDSSPETYQ